MESKRVKNPAGFAGCGTFNRTSMESKLRPRDNKLFYLIPFNRTSMESKREKHPATHIFFGELLIEPVWNRNSQGLQIEQVDYLLLIEPVWNRN